jgi:hypothetical protein
MQMGNLKKLSDKRLVNLLMLEVQMLTEFCEMSGGTPKEKLAIRESELEINAIKAEILRRMQCHKSLKGE